MPTVEMNHQISGARDGQTWPAKGGRIEVAEQEAEELIRNGFAKLVNDVEAAVKRKADAGLTTGSVEAAVAPTVETASLPEPK
uniref:Uncharacterized protein n=1 Tax=uncultured organism TaxID=155900 RepID=A0A7L9QBS1_9ZZZZ|nr:hypothetical protein [uncultured organism]